jgi:ribonuclease E
VRQEDSDLADAEFTGNSPGESAGSEAPAASKGRRRGGAKRRSKVAKENPLPAAKAGKASENAAGEGGEKLEKASSTREASVATRRKPRRRKGRGDPFSERSELLPAGAGIAPPTEDGAKVQDAAPQPQAAKPYHRILINADDSEEVRIAVLEEGQLEELHYERPNEQKYLGNIYKGRVMNLEPGIQAAFVDLGIGRNGFLHVSDVLPAYKDRNSIPIDSLSVRLADRRRLRIQDVLRKGQEILVQISKDAIGAKGPSLTTYVSVPGKYLVLMPGVSRHGVSKRIQGDDERSNLREKLSQLNPPKGMGFIIRTAGQQLFQADLEKDFQYLMKVWETIYERVKEPSPASMIYAETDLVIRTLRDLSGPDVNEILIDDRAVYERAKKFLDEIIFEGGKRLKHYTGATPIFSKFGVEEEIEKIYNRRVPLPNGGHIVLEQTEALVAIDVNSGKYRDEEDLEATALKTNLEAAQEIARQLRLRDLGGVIVNDFIDMESEANRRAVERALRMALKRDRAKSWITEISRFGIIEMTRQRVRPSFERAHHEPCKTCSGTGVVKAARSVGIAILRQIRAGVATKRRNLCEVLAPPAVVDYLLNERRRHLVELENNFSKTIIIKACVDCTQDRYSIKYR